MKGIGLVNRLGIIAAVVTAVCVTAALAAPINHPPMSVPALPPIDPEKPFDIDVVQFTWSEAPAGARHLQNGWFPARAAKGRPTLPKEITKAFIIPIRAEINDTLYKVLARKALQARIGGAQLVIFDMNTPGGAMGAMEDITQLILDGELRNTCTIVYVNPNAYSAGAVISLACSEIAMAPSGVIGDAMPIMIGPQGLVELPPAERVKAESGARALVRAVAGRNGYSLAIGEAMITIGQELWLIRNTKTSELRVIDANDAAWANRVRGAPKVAAPPTVPSAAGTTPPAAASAPTLPDGESEWEFLKQIDGPNELATFTAAEAVEAGLADYVSPTMEDLLRHYNVTAPPVRLEDNWSESLVVFLTSPLVMGVLIFLAILGAYTEFQAPGFGLPGIVAIVCLAIAFGGQYLIGAALWWELLLIAVGVVLLALEIFVIPGFGVTGIAGILCLVVGIAFSIIGQAPDEFPWPNSPFAVEQFVDTAFALGLAFVLALLAMPVVSKFLPKIPVARRLVIAEAQAATDAPVPEDSPMMRVGVGDTGTVHSMLRPVGKVRFGQDILDAMSEGDIIETGAQVRVLRHEGNRLVVEKVS